MAKATVIGTRPLDFEDSKGNSIRGLQIFVTRVDKSVNGLISDKIFIPANSKINIPVFKFGTDYDFIYDGFGKKMELVEIKPIS